MQKNKRYILGVLALLLTFGQIPASEAAAVQETSSATSQNSKPITAEAVQGPTIIEADQIYFSNQSGDMFANGNVKITQNQDTILTDHMRGNQQKTTVWVDGSATLLQPDTQLTGNNITYNYGAKTGVFFQANGTVTKYAVPSVGLMPGSGKAKKEFFTGQKVELQPGYLVASEATFTGCELETPEYHISADKVEIWPGEKMVAYNAKFWLGDMVLYSQDRYEQSLKEEGSPFPSVGYDRDDGAYIRQTLNYPIADNVKAYANLAYYTKAKFKPNYGVKWDKSDYYFKVEAGDFRDSDSVWIEKKPEFELGIPKRRIGTLPLSYNFTATYGKWTEDDKTSWHQDYELYFTHDAIPLDKDKTLNLYLGSGVEHIRESYDGSVNTSWKFDSTLGKTWSPKLYTYVGYHYVQSQSSVFNYDAADVSTELAAGLSYAMDKKNTLSYGLSYDLDAQKAYSHTYGWNYNLHCWSINTTKTIYTDGQDSKLSVKLISNF